MPGTLQRHTSMRGRLALLLMLLLVLPMSLVGLVAYNSLATSESAVAADTSHDDISVSLEFVINEATTGLRHALDASLADLSLRAMRLASFAAPVGASSGDAAGGASPVASLDREAVFQNLKSGLRPTLIAFVDRAGRAVPDLPAAAREQLLPILQAGKAQAGYLLLPCESGQVTLHQIVFEPGLGGRGVLLLRDIGPDGGRALLESLPFGSRVVRALMLGDGTVVAHSVATQCTLARRLAPNTAAAPIPWPDEAYFGAHVSDSGSDGFASKQVGDVAFGALPLHDLARRPIAWAVVVAGVSDVLPGHEPPTALLAQVRSLVGWIALAGVLLAIGMGFVAPRWIWNDIRDSTNSIFHSVERLRELVRRNSRALDEQSRVVRTLTASASALKLASLSIADTTTALAHSAEQSAWVSQSGNQKAELSQRAVVDVRDRVEQISTQMEELQRRCMAIGSILGFIDRLSNETNTLSINATIQAVGAGSSGRQFSAVALEIKKLADLALESTRDIQQLIEEIQESSRTTLSATQEGCREVDKCLSSFEELESAFARILRWVEETTRSSHGIELSTARQSESLESVVQSIESLEQRASETSGNFHEVVDAADELARLGAGMNETWRVG